MHVRVGKAFVLIYTTVACMLCGCVCDHAIARRGPMPSQQHAQAPREDYALDVRYGRPSRIVDTTGWVVGIPRKLLLWDRRVDNHNVSDDTTQSVATFAETFQLDGLCARVNQYDPIDEFRRLRTNKTIAPGWRYTLGTMSVIGYTVIPGRIIGIDQYNPYTNSVYVYSDVPALAVEATAYAKDVRSRRLPGTYAAINHLPFVSVWHESVNVRDAVAFIEEHGTAEERIDGLRVLHANYGSSVAVATGAGPMVQICAAVAGQFTGRFQATRLADKAEESAQDKESSQHDSFELASATRQAPAL